MPRGPWEGKWELGEPLGAGGQGKTFLVSPKGDRGSHAVIKILRNNKSPQARVRMHREVANLQALVQAGAAVPRVLDHNTDAHEADPSTKLYALMEYIPGQTLRQIVDERGPLPPEVAKQIVFSLCETIKIAHTFPIVHRDLKPENIIARNLEEADVVVVDYGLSFNATTPNDATRDDETFRNKFLDLPETNTPGGNRRDPRSDVTAACAIFHYLLTGNVPVHLLDADSRPPHKRTGPSLHERLGGDEIAGPLGILFNRGFAQRIEDRFQTIDELQFRIDQVFHPLLEEERDPLQVARKVSARLREEDRNTQLRSLGPSAEKILGEIRAVLQAISKNLSGDPNNIFGITSENLALSTEPPLPDNVDPVLETQHVYRVKTVLHQLEISNAYTVGSTGTECVLLSRVFARAWNSPNPYKNEWEPVLWYEGGNPGSAHNNAARHFRAWVATSIEAIGEAVGR